MSKKTVRKRVAPKMLRGRKQPELGKSNLTPVARRALDRIHAIMGRSAAEVAKIRKGK